MNNRQLSDALGEIRDYYIQDAAQSAAKKRPAWRKWAAAAACLCLVLVGALAARHWLTGPGEPAAPDAADCCLYLDGEEDVCYLRFTYQDYIRFGVLPESTPRASAEELRALCAVPDGELGEALGVVTTAGEAELVGKTAYRYESASGDEVCVVKTDDRCNFFYRQAVSRQERALAACELLDRAFGHDEQGYTLFPDDYAGCYVDGDRLVLLLTDTGEAAAARYRAWAGAYADTLVFEKAEYAYNLLKSKEEEMARELKDGGCVLAAYYVSETANRVVFEVVNCDAARAKELEAGLRERYGVPVSVRSGGAFVTVTEP